MAAELQRATACLRTTGAVQRDGLVDRSDRVGQLRRGESGGIARAAAAGRTAGRRSPAVRRGRSATTGVPQDIASAATMPNGSFQTGVTRARALLPTSSASSAWLRCPA